MNVRPLITRELRAEARRPHAHWVRTLAAGFLTLVLLWAILDAGAGSSGITLFRWLIDAFLVAILVIVSSLTGDSISREKREGTLGLLFLTPLTAGEIIIGKSLLHALRALVIFLSAAPLLGLPFLLGGITTELLLLSVVKLAAAFVIAIACGMVASIHSFEWMESLVASVLLSALLSWLVLVISQSYPFAWPALPISLAILALALVHAARRLRASWQSEGARAARSAIPSPGGPSSFPQDLAFALARMGRPIFRWDTRKARDRNPIAWLQEYNWPSRLAKWGWCLALFAAEMQLLFQFRPFLDYQMQLYRLTALAIAFSAAASFRRERETGALELLLVTPIPAARLIWGRLQGVWFHFFPAIAILACVWMMGPELISLPIRFAFYLAAAYLFTPIIGFYCSMLTSNVLIAWLLAVFFSQLLPYAITQAFRFDIGRRNIPFAFFMIELALALLAGFLLFDNLAKRRFALRRA